jgi:hypothetical protein
LKRFWLALEQLPGCAAVHAEWRWLLGSEFELTAPFLRSTGRSARAYPKLTSTGYGMPYRVVEHAHDRIVAVSEEGDRIHLSRADTVIHELDPRRFNNGICIALGLDPVTANAEAPGNTRLLGSYSHNGIRRSVFLSLSMDEAELTADAYRLAAATDDPFVLLVPTPRAFDHVLSLHFQDRGVGILCLTDLIGLDDSNRFALLVSRDRLLAQLPRPRPVSAPRVNGVYPPSTIVWHGTEHVCKLTKKEMAFLGVGLTREEVDIHEVMRKPGGCVWQERYLNTKGKRDKISQFLSRLNTKLLDAKPRLGMSFSLRRDSDCISRNDPTSLAADGSLTED